MATTSIPANCTAVTNQLLTETGRLGGRMFPRIALKRPIVRLQSKTRGAWDKGAGYTLGAVTFERSLPPLTGDPWAAIAASDGDTANACRPPTDLITTGQTTRTYTPKHYALNSPDYCIRDIQSGFAYQEFLNHVTRSQEMVTEWVWARRYTQDYVDIAEHNLTLNKTSGIQDSGGSGYNTSNLPTSALTQGVLDTIYMDLVREGGASMSGVDETTGGPVFSLIVSPETSRGIINSDPEMRTDLRYAYMGKGEMTPLVPGMQTKRRTFGGFVHEVEHFPRRFIFQSGAYVEVPAYIASSTTKGTKYEINPAYLTAPFEETIVWHEDNYQSLAVNTVGNPAPGWNFTPHDWLGSFDVRNIIDRTCNPDGTIIFFRALFADAAKPVNPKVGWSILHARCGIDLNLVDCYGYA